MEELSKEIKFNHDEVKFDAVIICLPRAETAATVRETGHGYLKQLRQQDDYTPLVFLIQSAAESEEIVAMKQQLKMFVRGRANNTHMTDCSSELTSECDMVLQLAFKIGLKRHGYR